MLSEHVLVGDGQRRMSDTIINIILVDEEELSRCDSGVESRMLYLREGVLEECQCLFCSVLCCISSVQPLDTFLSHFSSDAFYPTIFARDHCSKSTIGVNRPICLCEIFPRTTTPLFLCESTSSTLTNIPSGAMFPFER